MIQPADQVPPQTESPDGAPEPLPRVEVLRRIVTTLPLTLQERDIAVARHAIKAFRDGDELLAHELCNLHSHPVHAWRRVRADAEPPPELSEEDRAHAAKAELQRQRFEAIARNDIPEANRLALELGIAPTPEVPDVLPPPAPVPTTQHAVGVRVHYRRRVSWPRRALARAFDLVADYTPLGGLASAAAAITRGDTVVAAFSTRGRAARRTPVSPADVFTKSK